MSDNQEHQDQLGPKVEEGVERITWKKLWNHIADQFLLHSGLLLTIRELALRPEKVIRSYLFTEEGRDKFSNPISFIFITLIPVIFLLAQFHGFDQMSRFSMQFGGNGEDSVAVADSSQQVLDASTVLADSITNPED